MRGRGPRCFDRTIAGHDLPHTEVGKGRAALNGEANDTVDEGFFFFFFFVFFPESSLGESFFPL